MTKCRRRDSRRDEFRNNLSPLLTTKAAITILVDMNMTIAIMIEITAVIIIITTTETIAKPRIIQLSYRPPCQLLYIILILTKE